MTTRTREVLVEPLGADLVALAQCMALDASLFPHPSLPRSLDVTAFAPTVFIARETAHAPVIGFLGAVRTGGKLDVVGVGVAPSHRRRGAGRALLRAVLASAIGREIVKVALHVSTGNTEAIRLYESEGFRVARTLRGYYSARRFPNGGDAYEMVKAIVQSARFVPAVSARPEQS